MSYPRHRLTTSSLLLAVCAAPFATLVSPAPAAFAATTRPSASANGTATWVASPRISHDYVQFAMHSPVITRAMLGKSATAVLTSSAGTHVDCRTVTASWASRSAHHPISIKKTCSASSTTVRFTVSGAMVGVRFDLLGSDTLPANPARVTTSLALKIGTVGYHAAASTTAPRPAATTKPAVMVHPAAIAAPTATASVAARPAATVKAAATATASATPKTTPSATAPATTAPASIAPAKTAPAATASATTAPVTTAPVTAATQPSVGALPVGQAAYPVPANAIHVAPTGSDANHGTAASPVQTVAHALSIVPAGGTIVLHAGTYHEALGYITKQVTIENAPGEAAWLDGSQVMSNFTAEGSDWTTPYSYSFNSGPTYKKDQADYTQANWAFINQNHPMAAHPDQVWVDGVAQQQVASASAVTAGTFYVDTAAQKLVLGTNPAGHEVRVATLTQAMILQGDGTVLRGFGVRNYANSQYMMGSVVSYASNVSIENLEIDNSATDALGLFRSNDTVTSTTVNNAGMTGIHGNNADDLVLNRVLVSGANAEKFNFAPAAAGIKVSRTDNLTLENSKVADNFATGLWTDEDTRDITVTGSTFSNNARNGIMLELSARSRVVNNRLFGNGTWGSESLLISDTNKTQVWNNTIVGPRTAIRLIQDSRTRANQPGVGDSRSGAIDADMSWQTANTVISDNVLQDDGAAGATLAEGRGNVNNYAVIHAQSYGGPTNQMISSENGNVVARLTGPQFAIVWQPAGASFAAYSTWERYRAAQSSQGTSSYYTGSSVMAADGTTVQKSLVAGAHQVAEPSDIAALAGTATPQVVGAN